jgi:hypothetical protein
MPYVKVGDGNELPHYRPARFHPSGKLWISEEHKFDIPSEADFQVERLNRLLADTSYGIRTRYFVWHAKMTEADLEGFRASTAP